MWRWDQGHLPFFQFDSLRNISRWVLSNDLKDAETEDDVQIDGLVFSVPETHTPWRNYARALKISLLISETSKTTSSPTEVAELLAEPGLITSDEYFHFFVRSFTDPSPALAGWSKDAKFRYPLLFAVKYLLAKVATDDPDASASFEEIAGAYASTYLDGTEAEDDFIELLDTDPDEYELAVHGVETRQARESLLVVSQISYLDVRKGRLAVSLAKPDAEDLFRNLRAIGGKRAATRDEEIRRLARLFRGAATDLVLDYPSTIVNDVVESGFENVSFAEGGKAKKTHLTIERNGKLRSAYFRAKPTAVCDVCATDTRKSFPWTERVLDLHHLLPLSSGTRVTKDGTSFNDLVAVCPTCHRAIHRFYDRWLKDQGQKDFASETEARNVYGQARGRFKGFVK